MIPDIMTVVQWEWFKLRFRWMPWILLAILLLVSQFPLWISFFSFKTLTRAGGQVTLVTGGSLEPDSITLVNCDRLRMGDTSQLPIDASSEIAEGLLQQCTQEAPRQQERLQEVGANFTIPGSITKTLRSTYSFALVLFTLLVASVIGMEYRMGTLHMVLTRGTGRWQYLAGKFLFLAVAAGAALGIVVVTTVTSSLIASLLTSGWPPPVESGGWAAAAAVAGKTWFSLLPYLALTGLVTLLTRSSAGGMAIGVGYLFIERILVGIFAGLIDWAGTLADYLLLQNMSGLVWGVSFGIGTTGPSQAQALAVLMVYWLGFSAGAFWLFQRRDVSGASGD